MNLPTNNTPIPTAKRKSPYRLTEEQEKVYNWLQQQGLNVDDDTLNYWSRKYLPQRLMDVVRFAQARSTNGQQIRNIGGWIHKLLKTGAAVVTDESQENRRFAEKYALAKDWKSLRIYEKYIRDEITGDDLPLTLVKEEFQRALTSLYQRVQLYK